MSYKKLATIALCMVAMLALAAGAASAWDVHHVDSARPNDDGDGLSWGAAEKTVGAAITAASSGDEIWVKAGTYTQCITLKSGVGLYGGFAGTETSRDQRNWTTNVTTLDGTGGNNSVVTGAGTSTTVIDGFTITYGAGKDSGGYRNGGGIYCLSCSPTISNNKITANTLQGANCSGGGIFCWASSPVISNNEITNNSATGSSNGAGGGIQLGSSSPTLSGNTIQGNAANQGGGINCANGAAPTFTQTNVIAENNATVSGGGVAIGSGCGVVLTGADIWGNTADSGAGVLCGSITATIANSRMSGNSATTYGGAIKCSGNGQTVANIINNVIANCTAGTNGGAIMCDSASPKIANNTIVGNTATSYCGGISCYNSSPEICNNIVAFNSSGIRNSGTGSPTLNNNCVFNTSSNYDGISAGTGDISANPLLLNRNGGDYHLTSGSPCIDAGEDDEVVVSWTDMDGGNRKVDYAHKSSSDIVDIGADEFVLIHVKTDGDDTNNDGSTWALAKATVQAGLDAAPMGGEVWVKAGPYTERITLRDGVSLYGGFAGAETCVEARPAFPRQSPEDNTSNSILDGSQGGTVVTCGSNCTAGFDGFTVINGATNLAYGTGMDCRYGSSITITNNTFKGNAGTHPVVKLMLVAPNAVVSGNTITQNTGPGLEVSNCASASVTDNIITYNTEDGLCLENTTATYVARNTIAHNEHRGIEAGLATDAVIASNVIMSNSFGAIYVSNTSDPNAVTTIAGNLIASNQTGSGGSAVRCSSGTQRIVNNTIVANVGDGIQRYGTATLHISNNIIALNSSGIKHYGSGAPVLHNNNVYSNTNYDYSGVTPDATDISSPPLFVDAANGNYELQTDSPCIDAGYNSATGTPTEDIDGIARPIDGNGDSTATVDMGAYEYHRDVAVFATGGTTNRKVMGLHHYPFGEEFWNDATSAIQSDYDDLLESWSLGCVRAFAHPSENVWDAHHVPFYAYVHDGIAGNWDGWAYPDENGHQLGVAGYTAIASKTNATLCWPVNMHGHLDSYGAAKYNSQLQDYVQGAAYGPGLYANPPGLYDITGEPDDNERRYWCDDQSNYSIYEYAKDMATAVAAAYPAGERVYEMENEEVHGEYIPEAYWKTQTGEVAESKRVSWGMPHYHPNNSDEIDKLSTNDTYAPFNLTLDWTSGKTGSGGNVLYLGFPYKPWMLEFTLATAGTEGSLKWEHQADGGTWHEITPGGALRADTEWHACCLDDPSTTAVDPNNSTMLDDIANMKYAGGNNYLFFLPLPRVVDTSATPDKWIGLDCSAWADLQNGLEYHSDWVRTQVDPMNPSTDICAGVRKLYWLRIYANAPYSTAPVEGQIGRYLPDYRDLLDSCNKIHDAIEAGDTSAKVVQSGPIHWGNNYQLTQDAPIDNMGFRNRQYWHFLKDNQYASKWDGMVIHPYVSADDRATVVGKVDSQDNGLIQQINEMRDVLDDNGFSGRSIACTEWGVNPDNQTLPPYTLAEGLYCLDGTLALMRSNADYAAWHCSVPQQDAYHSPFYTDESRAGKTSYPTANTNYVQRPVGLAMQMVADHARTTGHTVTRSLGGESCKAYAFSQSGKTSTMVLINSGSGSKNLSLSWPAVAGKNIWVSYLRTKSGFTAALDTDNENPSNQEVELTDPADSTQDVPTDGTFEFTIPAFCAVGIEFKD